MKLKQVTITHHGYVEVQNYTAPWYNPKNKTLVSGSLRHVETGLIEEYIGNNAGDALRELGARIELLREEQFLREASPLFHVLMAASAQIDRWDITDSKKIDRDPEIIFVDNLTQESFICTLGLEVGCLTKPLALLVEEKQRFEDALRRLNYKWRKAELEKKRLAEHSRLTKVYVK